MSVYDPTQLRKKAPNGRSFFLFVWHPHRFCHPFRRRRYSQYAIKKIKNAASKIAIIQYRILPEDFFAQRKGFAAWQ